MDTEGLYEGGKHSKRKRDFDDDDSDDGGSHSRNSDPNAYNPNMAKVRHNLIKSELNKRRSGNDMSESKPLTDEEKQRAKETVLTDPHNSKISNLTLKSRENWFTKMCQVMQDNFNLFSNNPESTEAKKLELCVKFEYEILEKAKNLSIYQAKCMTKYKEIRNLTAEKKSYLKYYLEKEASLIGENDSITKSDSFIPFDNLKISGFTNASKLIPGEFVKPTAFSNSPAKKIKVESQNSVFAIPKFEKKSIFDEIEKKDIEKVKEEPYTDLLNNSNIKVKTEAERIREARLFKMEKQDQKIEQPIEIEKSEQKIEQPVKIEKIEKLVREEEESTLDKLNNETLNENSVKEEKTLDEVDCKITTAENAIKSEKIIKEENVKVPVNKSSGPLGLAAVSAMVVLELTPFYKANKFRTKVSRRKIEFIVLHGLYFFMVYYFNYLSFVAKLEPYDKLFDSFCYAY